MLNVENMEAGNQLIANITARNSQSSKSGQNDQAEGPSPDFLMDVLSKLYGENEQGSMEGPVSSGELKELGIELLSLGFAESLFQDELPGKTGSEDQALSFPLEITADQIEEKQEVNQEGNVAQTALRPLAEYISKGKKDILKNFLNKIEESDLCPNPAILLRPGEGIASRPDQSPVSGTLISEKGTGEESPDPVNPKGERPTAKQSAGELLLKNPVLNSGTGPVVLFKEGEDPLSQSDQSPVEGTLVSGKGSGEESPALVNPKLKITKVRTGDLVIVLKEADQNLNMVSFISDEKGPVPKLDRSPVDGAPISGKESGEESPTLISSTREGPVEGREVQGAPDLKKGSNSPLDENFLLNKLKTFVDKIFQPLSEEPAPNVGDPGEGKSAFQKSLVPATSKDNLPREGLAVEIIKIQPAQDRPSSNSIIMGKVERVPSGKKEDPKGSFSFSQEGFRNEPKGIFLVENRERPEIIFDSKGLNNQEVTPTGEKPPENGSRQTPTLPIGTHDQIFREAMINEKNIRNNQDQLNHLTKTHEFEYLKDHSFSIKKQTSSSMEITLEPAGLGKLDIELNLNQDRLQGQIMVSDKAGKELIERNLPQLLSDLTREGLQIGGFTVSLRNQGRSQNPILNRTEFEEPLLKPVSPEKMVAIQENHLIHIVV